jgi:dUTP pyrophosphatase
MENKQERAERILKYPAPHKTGGFKEVDKEHKIFDDIKLPTRGSKDSAGYDLYSNEDVDIYPNQQHIFWTDIKSYMLSDEVLQIYVRSSIGIKKSLVLGNGTGIIDSDYYNNPKNDGNIAICLRNESDIVQHIIKGEAIAQGIFLKYYLADDIETENKRNGGLGSTN